MPSLDVIYGFINFLLVLFGAFNEVNSLLMEMIFAAVTYREREKESFFLKSLLQRN